jgi:hypothetical protein
LYQNCRAHSGTQCQVRPQTQRAVQRLTQLAAERASQAGARYGTRCATRRRVHCRVKSGVEARTEGGVEFPGLGAIDGRTEPRTRRETDLRAKSLIDCHIDRRSVLGIECRSHPRIDPPVAGRSAGQSSGLGPGPEATRHSSRLKAGHSQARPLTRVPSRTGAHSSRPSGLGPAGARGNCPGRTSPDGRGDGCSDAGRENTEQGRAEVFWKGSTSSPGDSTGVNPGYTPVSSQREHGESRIMP